MALLNQRHLLPALLALTVLASGCVSAGDGDNVGQVVASTDAPVTSTPADPTSKAIVATTTVETTSSAEAAGSTPSAEPLRAQFDWVMGVINGGGLTTTSEIEERFSPSFLAAISANELSAFMLQIAAFAELPYRAERFEPDAGGLMADAVLLSADGQRLEAQIVIDPQTPNLIEGIWFVPADLEFPDPVDINTLADRLSELASRSALGVYDVSNGSCDAVYEIRTESPIVLGSVFKLWVLAALAHEIDEGRVSWNETLAVSNELRSSADGDTFGLETGTEVTLQQLAESMIAISDNTATDMLLDRLGRETVEATMERIGIADPAVNVPMLSTGNLFALKFAPETPNAEDYRALDAAGKRMLLEELDRAVAPWVAQDLTSAMIAQSVNADGIPIDEPRDLDLEWFSTAEDLCRTLMYLDELADRPGLAQVASILEINAGTNLPFDRDRWPTIRFKGGSEPGVLAGAWWFEGVNGDRFVVAGGLADPDSAFDPASAALTLASAIELIE